MKLVIKPQTLQKWLHGGHPVSCHNIEKLCCYYLVCIQRWETTRYKFCSYEKAIHRNFSVHIKTDALHSHKCTKVLFEEFPVDGNTSACASTHHHAYQYSNWGYKERKHERSKKTKNSYIGYFRVCIKTNVFEDKKPEYYKICSVLKRNTTNYIPTLVKSFVIWFLANSCRKTHVNA